MLDLLLTHIVIGAIAGLFSWLWVFYLTGQGMLFHWVPRLLFRLEAPEWLHKPVHECETCNSFWVAVALFPMFCPVSVYYIPGFITAVFLATKLGAQ